MKTLTVTRSLLAFSLYCHWPTRPTAHVTRPLRRSARPWVIASVSEIAEDQ